MEALPRLRKVSGCRVLILQLSRISTLRFPIRGNVPFPKLFWPELEFLNSPWGLGTEYRNRVIVPARQAT